LVTEVTTNSGQSSPGASAPSSSNSPGQTSAAASPAPGAAASASPQQQNQTPARPSAVLETEWDAGSGRPNDKYWERANKDTARLAEYDVRKNTLPKSDTDYELKLPGSFQLPAGTTFEFDKNSPDLAAARKVAHARGLDQETFSDMLGVYAASKITEQTNQAKAREANLAALGAAGPQRVEAIATWLTAKAGDDGKQVGDFIRAYPAAPIVKAMENLIKQFSSQGGADFSQSHRDQAEEGGKIPGYENMSFVQRRIAQMSQAAQRRPPAGR
jgi:hypothetical protein